MRTICLFFQIHQPFRLRRYRFFDIGTEHYYYDDYSNESTLHRAAEKSYIHANKIVLETINKHKDKFKVAFSISGTALDQFELYAPEVLESFQKLAATGQVEFLCETDSHSLVSLSNPEEFEKQVNAHRAEEGPRRIAAAGQPGQLGGIPGLFGEVGDAEARVTLEDAQAVLHEHVVVRLFPGGAAQFGDARAFGEFDPDFGNENTFEVKTNDLHGTLLLISRKKGRF